MMNELTKIARIHGQKFFVPAFFKGKINANFFTEDLLSFIENNTDSFDIIALDIDNGPEAFSSSTNELLYSCNGLELLKNRLKNNGVLLLWSSFRDLTFESRAHTCEFTVVPHPVQISEKTQLIHFIYRLTVEKIKV